jgi:hypothetical protein
MADRIARLTYAHFCAPVESMRVLGALPLKAWTPMRNPLIYIKKVVVESFSTTKNLLEKKDLTQLSQSCPQRCPQVLWTT